VSGEAALFVKQRDSSPSSTSSLQQAINSIPLDCNSCKKYTIRSISLWNVFH